MFLKVIVGNLQKLQFFEIPRTDFCRRLNMKALKRIISAAVFAIMSVTMTLAQDAEDELYEYITVDGNGVSETKDAGKEQSDTKSSDKKAEKNKDGLSFEISKELKTALKKPGKNSEQILELTFNLTEAQKQELYDVFSKTKGTAIGMNWLPGFGSGSFVQGDVLGGSLGVTFDTIALVSEAGGLCVGFVGILVAAFSGGMAEEQIDELFGWAAGLMIGGGVLWIGNKIFGTIRPINFAKNYNKDLKAALGLEEKVESVSFLPIVDPVTSNYGLATQIRF